MDEKKDCLVQSHTLCLVVLTRFVCTSLPYSPWGLTGAFRASQEVREERMHTEGLVNPREPRHLPPIETAPRPRPYRWRTVSSQGRSEPLMNPFQGCSETLDPFAFLIAV